MIKVAKHYDAIQGYIPAVPVEVLAKSLGFSPQEMIKADANENPYGASGKVADALVKACYPHLYPDPGAVNLCSKLADFVAAPADQIMVSNGADELILMLIRLFLEPGDTLINLPPTFDMYDLHAKLSAANVLEIPRKADFSIDYAALRKAAMQPECKLVFLTTPNNPDGQLMPKAEIEALLDLPIMIVVDEAYIEFSSNDNFGRENSIISRVPEVQNLIVLRTFSKWAGLAGLRVGYGIFPAWLMPHLWKIKQPYNVNCAAQAAAAACLDDLDYYQDTIQSIIAERERMYKAFSALPNLKVLPSQTNFLLCQLQGHTTEDVCDKLKKEGILIRGYNKPSCPNALRISIMKPEQNDRILQGLEKILKGGTPS
ncbi:MAG: histidinol-phosphate transaminase [Anaerolineaceae bacterium]|nr:histidinol-phosphate transaminase [Anaerolineaceae bacterium]